MGNKDENVLRTPVSAANRNGRLPATHAQIQVRQDTSGIV
ncbi:hypothetical protein BN137_3684 [Cronobacter condimenti 1330]|uniref:Uncharacterized protein n=1 Tax=Cronobacter condimenti 1330 TaxID=1073999 RepID=K8A390_9ENTR|nr:hypothetical protein BN137_3684 [Cronobacter condimenti 1330]